MPNSPLREQDCETCDRVMRRLADLAEEIKRMEACGHDCTDLEEKRRFLYDKAAAYKREYFPDRT